MRPPVSQTPTARLVRSTASRRALAARRWRAAETDTERRGHDDDHERYRRILAYLRGRAKR